MPADTTRRTNRERLAARRAAETAAWARAERRRRTVIGGVVAAVVVVIALVIVVQTQRTAPSAGAAAPANADGTVISVGSADARVTVDLYEDFQCPNCKTCEDESGSMLAQLVADGTVRARYHGMAFLDTSANDDYSTRALNAAAVVAAAAGPDGFRTFHDVLFADQPAEGGSGLTDDQLIAYAAQAGASGGTVEHDIRDLTYGDWVATATDQASKDGVTGTPTVFVDGEPLADLSSAGLTAAVGAAQVG